MPDKEGRPVRGEQGHWRYDKDISCGNKFDENGKLISQGPPELGVTTTETPGLKGTDLPKSPETAVGTPDPKGVYSKDVAKGFNRGEQMNLLLARKIDFTSKNNEKQLVDKILKSNPKKKKADEEQKKKAEEADEELNAPLEPSETVDEDPKEPHKYTEIELENYKSSALAKILRGLAVKKIPHFAIGRIKKILELQK